MTKYLYGNAFSEWIRPKYSNLRDILNVTEYESFLDVESARYDVFGVLMGQFVSFLDSQVLPQELFIVCHLYHQWHIKGILQPP